MSGIIDGVMSTVVTSGDGACGLHSLFGVIVGYRLSAGNIRQRVLQALPSNLASLCACISGDVRKYLFWVLVSAWAEAKTVAKRLAQMHASSHETKMICDVVPESIRGDFQGLVETQRYEQRRQKDVMDTLMFFASQLLQPGNEEHLLRPFCLFLEYSDASVLVDPTDMLNSRPHEDNFKHEGRRGGLELLHPCVEDPTLNKYQTLFLPQVEFDRYRRAGILD